MRDRDNRLAGAVARIQSGDDPDAVVAALHTSCDGHRAVVPEAYLEPLPRSARLLRSPAGLLLDLCARTCADARAIGERLTVFAAHRIDESRAYRRLGYRTAADYVREQLAITPREFRDLARLGRRLGRLPRIRRAYLEGELTRTQADVVAGAAVAEARSARGAAARSARGGAARSARGGAAADAGRLAGERVSADTATVRADDPRDEEEGAGWPEDGARSAEDGATPRDHRGPEADEMRWLEMARTSTVRELKKAAREAREGREARDSMEVRGKAKDGGEASDVVEAREDGPSSPARERVTFEVPPGLLGKIDAVLDLATRVAGSRLPAGTLWEFIAAEYLSGVSHGVPHEGGDESPGGEDGDGNRAATERLPAVDADRSPADEDAAAERSDGRDVACPEDPMGRQRYLEETSRNWSFLPSARMEVRPEGSWKRLAATGSQLAALAQHTGPARSRQGLDATGEVAGPSPWELHRQMTAALEQVRTVNWQLGRMLALIRNRRLWRDMLFSSFGHYVRERLGISVRHAQRLVRADRMAMMSPAFAGAWKAGEVSALQADLLARVLTWVGSDDVKRAWVETARRSTFDRFSELVRCAERLRREDDPAWCRSGSHPSVAEARLGDDEENAARLRRGECLEGGSSNASCSDPGAGAGGPDGDATVFVTSEGGSASGATVFVTSAEAAGPGATLFVTSYGVWMTGGERETLARAFEAARAELDRGRAPPESARIDGRDVEPVPNWACLELLLDGFVAEYGGELARTLSERYPIFERDGWRCRVPGCRAVSALHAHHIVFRARSGSDEPENLVVLCDWHHQVLHEGWIRCVGKAPDRLYWELGVGDEGRASGSGGGRDDDGGGLPEAPVARFLGHRRLADDEYWDGVGIRKIREGAPVA